MEMYATWTATVTGTEIWSEHSVDGNIRIEPNALGGGGGGVISSSTETKRRIYLKYADGSEGNIVCSGNFGVRNGNDIVVIGRKKNSDPVGGYFFFYAKNQNSGESVRLANSDFFIEENEVGYGGIVMSLFFSIISFMLGYFNINDKDAWGNPSISSHTGKYVLIFSLALAVNAVRLILKRRKYITSTRFVAAEMDKYVNAMTNR